MKKCRKCKETKAYTDFDKHKDCIGGVVATCKSCRRDYQILNRDKDNWMRRKRYAKDPTKVLKMNARYQSENRDKILEYLKYYAKANRSKLRDYHREWSLEWRENNRGVVNLKAATYRASKMRATPKWLSAEDREIMKLIYENCPKGYEVDHIIPLQHPEVQGLHVPWNLQYLSIFENRSKSNRLNSPKSDLQASA